MQWYVYSYGRRGLSVQAIFPPSRITAMNVYTVRKFASFKCLLSTLCSRRSFISISALQLKRSWRKLIFCHIITSLDLSALSEYTFLEITGALGLILVNFWWTIFLALNAHKCMAIHKQSKHVLQLAWTVTCRGLKRVVWTRIFCGWSGDVLHVESSLDVGYSSTSAVFCKPREFHPDNMTASEAD